MGVDAYVGADLVGSCHSLSGGHFSRDLRAQDWVYTTELWVEEALQGRGLGRYLLLRALFEARAAGYRHAAISTELTNHRGMLFYSNVGYRAVDWTTCYHKGAVNEPA